MPGTTASSAASRTIVEIRFIVSSHFAGGFDVHPGRRRMGGRSLFGEVLSTAILLDAQQGKPEAAADEPFGPAVSGQAPINTGKKEPQMHADEDKRRKKNPYILLSLLLFSYLRSSAVKFFILGARTS
jgi:hypothetical protein